MHKGVSVLRRSEKCQPHTIHPMRLSRSKLERGARGASPGPLCNAMPRYDGPGPHVDNLRMRRQGWI